MTLGQSMNPNKLLLLLFVFVLIISQLYAQKTIQKYGIKSGIIEYTYSGSAKGTETIYFEDYGMNEVKYSNFETKFMGIIQKNKTMTITDSKWIISIDLITKIATRTKNPAEILYNSLNGNEQRINNFGEELIKYLGGKKAGTGKVLNKVCTIWKIKKTKTQNWLWNFIPLKSYSENMGMQLNIEAVKLQTNVKIPTDRFRIPQGIKIKEIPTLR